MSISGKERYTISWHSKPEKLYSAMFRFCHQKEIHHFFPYVRNCLLFTFGKSSEIFKMNSDVSSCPELQAERQLWRNHSSVRSLPNTSVCYFFQGESLTSHLIYTGSVTLESSCSKCRISTLFPPKTGQADIKISKRCAKEDRKLGF